MKGGFCTLNIFRNFRNQRNFFLETKLFQYTLLKSVEPTRHSSGAKYSLSQGFSVSLSAWIFGSVFFFKSSKFILLIQLIKMCGLFKRADRNVAPFLHGNPVFDLT